MNWSAEELPFVYVCVAGSHQDKTVVLNLLSALHWKTARAKVQGSLAREAHKEDDGETTHLYYTAKETVELALSLPALFFYLLIELKVAGLESRVCPQSAASPARARGPCHYLLSHQIHLPRPTKHKPLPVGHLATEQKRLRLVGLCLRPLNPASHSARLPLCFAFSCDRPHFALLQ